MISAGQGEGNLDYFGLPIYKGKEICCAYCEKEFSIGDIVWVSKEGNLFCPEFEGKMCVQNWVFCWDRLVNFRSMKFLPRSE